jgi:hypothetical protein
MHCALIVALVQQLAAAKAAVDSLKAERNDLTEVVLEMQVSRSC